MANSVYYGTCTTAAAEKLKIVTIKLTSAEKASISDTYKNGDYLTATSAFFKTGDLLTVHFTYSNTNTAPQLVIKIGDSSAEVTDVSSYGRSILYKTEAAAGSGSWDAGETITFTHILSADGKQTHWDINEGGRATSTVYGVTKLESFGIDDTSGAISLNKAKNLIELATGGSLSYTPKVASGTELGTLTLTSLIGGEEKKTNIQLFAPSNAGFATQTWVTNKGYTTLNAVQTWVNQQGFLKTLPQNTMYPYNGTPYGIRVWGGEKVDGREDCGVSNTYARGDHVHRIWASTITGALGYTPSSNIHTHTIVMGRTDRNEEVLDLEYGKAYYLQLYAPTGTGSTVKRFRMPKLQVTTGDLDNYALVDHTHAIELRIPNSEEVYKISQREIVPVSLDANHYYTLVAGGKKVIFHTPEDTNESYIVEEIKSKNLLFTANGDMPDYGSTPIGDRPSDGRATTRDKKTLVIHVDCAKNGYTPVGIVGWNAEQGDVGENSSFNKGAYKRPERINVWSLFIGSGQKINCQLSNLSSEKNCVYIKFKVLYKKN